MIGLALFQPEIPQNAGTLLRLATCLGVTVDIIEPCGFIFSDRRVKRAGMDYLKENSYHRWPDWAAFHGHHNQGRGKRLILLTPDASVGYTDFSFTEDDTLVVGRESDGFPKEVLSVIAHQVCVPMQPGYRSLNVATAASMVLGEGLRQTKQFFIAAPIKPKEIKLLPDQQQQATKWFSTLQQQIIDCIESIEENHASPCPENPSQLVPGKFHKRSWNYSGEGGGTSAILKGRIFEKAGVNISCIKGEFSKELRGKVLGALEDPHFWAAGISLVIHPWSPFIPTIHFNTRVIQTTNYWFGGGLDLTPMMPDFQETDYYHQQLKELCDRYDSDCYERFRSWCDRYFYLPHRKEMRGISGIFYDHVNSHNWQKDWSLTQSVGQFFLKFYPFIVSKYIDKSWACEERNIQLKKRGRYVEYNLLYDRGTLFGLQTGGDIEAILMSLPPTASWV